MATAADRNLLFGLLALQNGLIDQDQLVAAFRAWSRDKSRQIARLPGRPRRPGRRPARAVEVMVGLHEKKHGGDAEKSLAAIPAGRSTRESLAATQRPARSRQRWAASGPAALRAEPMPTPTAPPPTPSARPLPTASGSASCGLMRKAAWAPSSSPSTAN